MYALSINAEEMDNDDVSAAYTTWWGLDGKWVMQDRQDGFEPDLIDDLGRALFLTANAAINAFVRNDVRDGDRLTETGDPTYPLLFESEGGDVIRLRLEAIAA